MLPGDSVLHSRPIGVHLNTVNGSCIIAFLQGEVGSRCRIANCQQPHAAAALIVQVRAGSVTADHRRFSPANSTWGHEMWVVSSVTCRARRSAVRTPSRLSGRCAAASCDTHKWQQGLGFRCSGMLKPAVVAMPWKHDTARGSVLQPALTSVTAVTD